MERQLATIRRIAEIKPIEGADVICSYRVDGWWVVGKKDEFKVNDLVVYFEIDSWIPHEIAPFLSKGKEPREYNGIKGERLKTIKLKGSLSQGLILPLNGFPFPASREKDLQENDDVTAELQIQKWERPIHASMAARSKGNFPFFIPKTDEERVQNLTKELEKWKQLDHPWEVTEKLDGSSLTVFFNNGEYGVCSRNYQLKTEDDNPFCNTARKYQIEEAFKEFDAFGNLAIQGELIGPGVQGNKYKLTEHKFYVFAIFDIDDQKYLDCWERYFICEKFGLEHTPVLHDNFSMEQHSIDTLLEIAEGKSLLADTEREGIVFKNQEDTTIHFKAISNKFLLNGGD